MKRNSSGGVFLAGAVPVWLIRLVSGGQARYPGIRRLCAWGASLLRGRDGVILRGAGQGLHFNVGNSHSGFILGTHKPLVQEFLASSLRSGMVFYDIGANVGFYGMIAARLIGSEGSVICFEPLPSNVQRIEHNALLNGFSHVIVRAEALGASDRKECFRISSEPTWGKLATGGVLPDKYAGDITVDVRTLDGLLHTASLRAPDVIKIDVEGAEGEVLAGAAETISRHRPLIVIELHSTNALVSSILKDLGYRFVVLGDRVDIQEAHWNASVVAIPQERPDDIALLKKRFGTADGR